MKQSTLQVEISGQTTENITPEEAIKAVLLSSLDANIHRFSQRTLNRLLNAVNMRFCVSRERDIFDDLTGYYEFRVVFNDNDRESEGHFCDREEAHAAALDWIMKQIRHDVSEGYLDIEKVWSAIMNVEA